MDEALPIIYRTLEATGTESMTRDRTRTAAVGPYVQSERWRVRCCT